MKGIRRDRKQSNLDSYGLIKKILEIRERGLRDLLLATDDR